jgi:two-component system sensor histidine kinase/response regulator
MPTDSNNHQSLEEQLALSQARLRKLEADFVAEREANKEVVIQLQHALAIKAEFTAHVNHELRTPLNGMLPMIEMILRSDLSPETREYVLTLREAGLSLLNIINDVLDFSKIEAGRLEVASVQFSLEETLEGVAQILAPAASSKNLLMLSVIDKDLPETVIGDPQKIRQALLNLCGNAIKFTETGIVTLKVSSVKPANKSRQLLFTVTDSGPGISPDLMAHLFEPFFQGPVAKENNTTGTGLGLSISKRLIELMCGRMFVDSTLNVGSTFGFYLPQEEPANQEILRVWASPQVTPSPLAPERTIVEPIIFNLSAVTLEPVHDGRFAIADLLKTFDLTARSSDTAQGVYAILAAKTTNQQSPTPGMTAVFLDTVRLKDDCLRLRALLNDSALVHSVKLVEVVAHDSLSSKSQSKLEEEILTIPMPLRRQVVTNCLSKLTNKTEFHATIRAGQSTTLGLEALASVKAAAALLCRGEKKQALVADDNKLNQRVAFIFLTDLGFEVDLVGNGIEAVRAFKKKHYDLVFLDCQMPTLDGFEAAKIIKEIQQRRGIPVPLIAVTASALEGSREHCLANGMDDYISKPIDPDSLEKVVTNWLGNSFIRDTPSRATQINNITSGTFVCQQANFVKLRKMYSEKQLKGILSLFRENCKADLAELKLLLSNSELALFQQKLERFKDCCEIIDAVHMAKLCLRLEEATKQCNQSIALEQMEKLSHLALELDKELESALADRSTYTLPTISHPK